MWASMVAPTVWGVGVSSEWMVTAVDSALSSVRWRAAILLRLASIALALKARMYSAWEAAKHLRTAVRRVWRAPWCVPDENSCSEGMESAVVCGGCDGVVEGDR